MYRQVDLPPKLLHPQWRAVNKVQRQRAEVACNSSDRLAAESRRLVEDTEKEAVRMRQEVQHRLEHRIQEIRYWRDELLLRLDENQNETDVLLTYRTRLQRALESCAQPLCVTLQCLAEREKRTGVDLVLDDVEKELVKEKEVIEGVTLLLRRSLEQVEEQIRLNRSVKYHLEKDLKDKRQAEQIDDFCTTLTTNSDVSNIKEKCNDASASVTPEEWENFSRSNISEAERQMKNSLTLRALVDSLLEQTAADMRRQHERTSTALERRIEETRNAKRMLEEELARIQEQTSNQEKNIAMLKIALEDMEGPLRVAQAQLDARSQRPGVELCRDPAHKRLRLEVMELLEQMNRLRTNLCEAETELRNLTRNQLALEEEIQVKALSLYIDEVVCTQLREPISINNF